MISRHRSRSTHPSSLLFARTQIKPDRCTDPHSCRRVSKQRISKSKCNPYFPIFSLTRGNKSQSGNMITRGFQTEKTCRVKVAEGGGKKVQSLFIHSAAPNPPPPTRLWCFNVTPRHSQLCCVVLSYTEEERVEKRGAADIGYNGTTRGETVRGSQHLCSPPPSFTPNSPTLKHSSGSVCECEVTLIPSIHKKL